MTSNIRLPSSLPSLPSLPSLSISASTPAPPSSNATFEEVIKERDALLVGKEASRARIAFLERELEREKRRNRPASPPSLGLLPSELHFKILGFASRRTLAACCRVSFAYLEIAIDLLYGNIELDNLRNLVQLFGQRGKVSFIQFGDKPYTSFLSRIRNFTFHLPTFIEPWDYPRLYLPLFINPLPIEHLRLTCTWSEEDEFSGHQLLDYLLPLFNPTSLHFTPLRSCAPGHFVFFDPHDLPRWTRLKHARLTETICDFRVSTRSWRTTYEIPYALEGGDLDHLAYAVGEMAKFYYRTAVSHRALQSTEVVVRTEEERVKAEEVIKASLVELEEENANFSSEDRSRYLEAISLVVGEMTP